MAGHEIGEPLKFARSRPAVHVSSNTMVIREILEHKSPCPETFKLKARVVDYEPKDLSRAIIRACTVCGDP